MAPRLEKANLLPGAMRGSSRHPRFSFSFSFGSWHLFLSLTHMKEQQQLETFFLSCFGLLLVSFFFCIRFSTRFFFVLQGIHLRRHCLITTHSHTHKRPFSFSTLRPFRSLFLLPLLPLFFNVKNISGKNKIHTDTSRCFALPSFLASRRRWCC